MQRLWRQSLARRPAAVVKDLRERTWEAGFNRMVQSGVYINVARAPQGQVEFEPSSVQSGLPGNSSEQTSRTIFQAPCGLPQAQRRPLRRGCPTTASRLALHWSCGDLHPLCRLTNAASGRKTVAGIGVSPPCRTHCPSALGRLGSGLGALVASRKRGWASAACACI